MHPTTTRSARSLRATRPGPASRHFRCPRLLVHGLLGLLLLGPADRASPQESNGRDNGAVTLEALLVTEEVTIQLDGRLDEAVWQDASAITDFTQQEPVEGGDPSERTEIRVVFDEDHLYIGAILYDDLDGILAYQRQRDASLGTDDRFMWILDTFLDGRTGYFFEINPAGLMGDGILT
ncbi:MAG: carbohydrate binding family 9 domain-containing protein, partial [Gemmatimonadetes bacterium]|nr:carbohydrate binding family 9 domain-containing protein [Gemmatimonadota bacterium]